MPQIPQLHIWVYIPGEEDKASMWRADSEQKLRLLKAYYDDHPFLRWSNTHPSDNSAL